MEYPIRIASSQDLENRISSLHESVYVKLAEIDELKGLWRGGLALSPQILSRLKKTALVTSAGASTRIEGAQLSDEQVRVLVDGVFVGKIQDRDVEEVKGYYEAARFVNDNFDDIKLTENHIKEIHKILVNYSSKDQFHKGEYKHLPNDVVAKDIDGREIGVVFKTMPPMETPLAMATLLNWLDDATSTSKYHPLLITASFVVEFLRIHPFVDGNGRMSRLLTDLLLLKFGYSYTSYVSMEKIIEDNKSDYYISLRKSQNTFGTETENISDFVEFFLKICKLQAEEAQKMLTVETILEQLSPSQRQVYDAAKRLGEFTIKEIVEEVDIPRPTIKQALEKLTTLRIIRLVGAGRGSRYLWSTDKV